MLSLVQIMASHLNAGLLLIIHMGTNFNKILIIIHQFSYMKMHLTIWGRVTHICVSKLTNIGSENGESIGSETKSTNLVYIYCSNQQKTNNLLSGRHWTHSYSICHSIWETIQLKFLIKNSFKIYAAVVHIPQSMCFVQCEFKACLIASYLTLKILISEACQLIQCLDPWGFEIPNDNLKKNPKWNMDFFPVEYYCWCLGSANGLVLTEQ